MHELAPRAVTLYTRLDVLTEELTNPARERPVSDDFLLFTFTTLLVRPCTAYSDRSALYA